MARIGLYPSLIIVVFGVVVPFFIFKLGRSIGFMPLLALAVLVGLGYGGVKVEYPWSEGSLGNAMFMTASVLAWVAYVALSYSAAQASGDGLVRIPGDRAEQNSGATATPQKERVTISALDRKGLSAWPCDSGRPTHWPFPRGPDDRSLRQHAPGDGFHLLSFVCPIVPHPHLLDQVSSRQLNFSRHRSTPCLENDPVRPYVRRYPAHLGVGSALFTVKPGFSGIFSRTLHGSKCKQPFPKFLPLTWRTVRTRSGFNRGPKADALP